MISVISVIYFNDFSDFRDIFQYCNIDTMAIWPYCNSSTRVRTGTRGPHSKLLSIQDSGVATGTDHVGWEVNS